VQAIETYSVLDAYIRAGVKLSVLLMTTAHLTDYYSVLRPNWRPTPVFGKLRCEVAPDDREDILREYVSRLDRVFTAKKRPSRLASRRSIGSRRGR
jgi:hypothetical protein